MKVFLVKDVEKVGAAGEVINVADGYAINYLLPRKLGVQVTPANEASFANRRRVLEHRKEVVATKTSLLAERIKSTTITVRRKMHDGDRLYGAITPGEIVDTLSEKGISIAKNQVIFDKSIKGKGMYTVTIKLSSSLQPKLTVKVIEE